MDITSGKKRTPPSLPSAIGRKQRFDNKRGHVGFRTREHFIPTAWYRLIFRKHGASVYLDNMPSTRADKTYVLLVCAVLGTSSEQLMFMLILHAGVYRIVSRSQPHLRKSTLTEKSLVSTLSH